MVVLWRDFLMRGIGLASKLQRQASALCLSAMPPVHCIVKLEHNYFVTIKSVNMPCWLLDSAMVGSTVWYRELRHLQHDTPSKVFVRKESDTTSFAKVSCISSATLEKSLAHGETAT